MESEGESLMKMLEAVYQPEHEYVKVDENDFQHLDLNFYSTVTAGLKNLGFTHLSDEEDITLRDADEGPALFYPIMIRALVSEDGTIMAGLYHPKMKWWISALVMLMRQHPGKIVDFETELSNGMFITTTNAKSIEPLNQSDRIISQCFPKKTSYQELLDLHQDRLTRYLLENSNVVPLKIENREKMIASQNRLQAIKSLYRGALGGVTKDELVAFSNGNVAAANKLWAEIEQYSKEKNESSERVG